MKNYSKKTVKKSPVKLKPRAAKEILKGSFNKSAYMKKKNK